MHLKLSSNFEIEHLVLSAYEYYNGNSSWEIKSNRDNIKLSLKDNICDLKMQLHKVN